MRSRCMKVSVASVGGAGFEAVILMFKGEDSPIVAMLQKTKNILKHKHNNIKIGFRNYLWWFKLDPKFVSDSPRIEMGMRCLG